MKKIISIIFVLTIIIVCSVNAFAESNIYPMAMVVFEINNKTDTVVFKDFNGNLWNYTNGTEDWAVGDLAGIIMYDNNTEIIYDDIIIDARYCGYLF